MTSLDAYHRDHKRLAALLSAFIYDAKSYSICISTSLVFACSLLGLL